jgi:hypothetical protein
MNICTYIHTYHECSSLFEVILLGPLAGCVGLLCSSGGRGFSVHCLSGKLRLQLAHVEDPDTQHSPYRLDVATMSAVCARSCLLDRMMIITNSRESQPC